MSGRMTGGKDQTPGTCKYFLVCCYTYPANKKEKPLLQRPDQDEEEDHPLPGLDDPILSSDPQNQQPGDDQQPQQRDDQGQQPVGPEAPNADAFPAAVAQEEPDPLPEESVPDIVEDADLRSAYMVCTTHGCASSMSPRMSLSATSLLRSPSQTRSMLVCALCAAQCIGCTVIVQVNSWLDLSINGVLTVASFKL